MNEFNRKQLEGVSFDLEYIERQQSALLNVSRKLTETFEVCAAEIVSLQCVQTDLIKKDPSLSDFLRSCDALDGISPAYKIVKNQDLNVFRVYKRLIEVKDRLIGIRKELVAKQQEEAKQAQEKEASNLAEEAENAPPNI